MREAPGSSGRIWSGPRALSSTASTRRPESSDRRALKLDFQRSSGNTSLSLVDDSWDYSRARREAWHADELDSQRLRAAEARAFVERPGAGTMLVPCPLLGSIAYPG